MADVTIHKLRLDRENITDLDNHPKPENLPDLGDYITGIAEEIDLMKKELEVSVGSGNTTPSIKNSLPVLQDYFHYQPDIAAVTKQIKGMQKVVTDINKPYERFWKSLTGVHENGPWTRTQESALDCKGYGRENCVHSEVDLIERLTRIFVRPAVLVQEDLNHRGIPRDANILDSVNGMSVISNCDEADWACQSFNDQLTYPKEKWTFILPTLTGSQQPIIDTHTQNMLQKTIPSIGTGNPGNIFPYDADSGALLPLFSQDEIIDLIPEPLPDGL